MTADAIVPGATQLLERGRALVGRLGGGVPGARRAVLAYGLYTLLLFVVCFVATFPHDLVVQRALTAATAGSPLRIETGRGSLGWSLAYVLDSLRVQSRDAGAEPLLLAEALRIAPSRLGLLRGTPYPVGIGASLYGGTLRATIDPRPDRFALDATLAGVDLARYTGLRAWVDGPVRGRLEGTVALDGGGRGLAAATGTVRVHLADLALEGTKVKGITLPELHFDDVHLNGTVRNGRLEIGELAGTGRELLLRGEGNVLLREPLGASPMSLDLTITPTAGAADGLKMMVNMIPGASGEGGARRVSVGGTLARPTVR